MIQLKKINKKTISNAFVVIAPKRVVTKNELFTKEEIVHIKKHANSDATFSFSLLEKHRWVIDPTKKDSETIRQNAAAIAKEIQAKKVSELTVYCTTKSHAEAFVEGILLTTYNFNKYFSKKNECTLKSLKIVGAISQKELNELSTLIEATFLARDLVNEPANTLTATALAKAAKAASSHAECTVFNQKKIESLRMGGILAVNKGSEDPATFSIIEWKPKKAKNKKPIVLVGKGVVYDTGGLSLKPTANSMDIMKSDMGGAAAVIGALSALSKNQIPYHVIGLIPATDNRPGKNAYAPGDVIKMFDGTTVEVLNTDAEGRMILADALSFSERYKPELIVSVATLTGAAARAIGTQGVVGMGNAKKTLQDKLVKSGETTHERVALLPFWNEYASQLKSTIADMTNLGGAEAGAITAGKFLEHFTKSPYIHLDIAGMAFMQKERGYLTPGGTGVGVRLLYDFIKNFNA